jgi:leader peptidase (prepilin peptidase)/N-methyltransferase
MSSHHIIPLILDHLAGGAMGLVSAGLACHFGMRSAERLPGESRLPRCLFCQRPLEWFEAFPLFGWLLRKDFSEMPCPCGERKNLWLHPVTEMIGAVLGMVAVTCAGAHWSWLFLPLCLGLGLLPAIAMIDFSFGIIPDMLNIALGIAGAIWLMATGQDVFLGLVNCGGLLAFGLLLALGYSKLRRKEVLGLGDVKFFAAAGMWLPVMMIPWFLALSGLLGVGLGLAWQKWKKEEIFPFAPALCLALAFCVLFSVIVPMD